MQAYTPNGQMNYVDCAKYKHVLTQHFAIDSTAWGEGGRTGITTVETENAR
jgi:hypothetical protein